jgi:hypothetical protein
MEWIQAHWVQIGVIALGVHTLLKAIRDAVDTTPTTDDNLFEKAVTYIGKITSYLFGTRAS